MFGCKAMLPVDLVFPTPPTERRTMYHWSGNMPKERQKSYQSMREVQGAKSEADAQIFKPLKQNNQTRCLVLYFHPRVIPGTIHKLRSFWARSYLVTKLIAPALAEINPVYYPREDKLVRQRYWK